MTYPVIPTETPQSAQDIADLIDADATAAATLQDALGVTTAVRATDSSSSGTLTTTLDGGAGQVAKL